MSGMSDLPGISVFVQVADLRSFVAAARVLGVSSSAVGKSVAHPELCDRCEAVITKDR